MSSKFLPYLPRVTIADPAKLTGQRPAFLPVVRGPRGPPSGGCSGAL